MVGFGVDAGEMCLGKIDLVEGILRQATQALHQGLSLLHERVIAFDQAGHVFAEYFDGFFCFIFCGLGN